MPRAYPLLSTKSNDKIPESSQSPRNKANLRPSPSSSRVSSLSVNRKEIPPHRLSDNLHWRCSTCNSLVTTSETGAHLIHCLIDIVGPFIGSGFLSNPLTPEHLGCLPRSPHMQSTVQQPVQRRSNDRPRTKKLERPTPNIKHPVIDETTFENEDDNSVSETSGDTTISCRCRKLIDTNKSRYPPENRTSLLNSSKCNLNHRMVTSKVISVNRNGVGWAQSASKVHPPPPPPPPPTASTVKLDSDKKVCNSCERSSAPERLHSHHNVKNKHHYHAHNNAHHHHYQPNQNHNHHNSYTHSRVNSSLKQDQSNTKESNNSTNSPPKQLSQRSKSKDEDDNIVNDSDNFKHSSTSFEEEEKDEENDVAGNNQLHDIDDKESPDLDNYSSLRVKCYLCRQEFGTDEIETHEIECLEKWKRANSNLPANQRVPMTFNTQGGEHRGSISSITGCDLSGWEHFKSQLTPCPKCARTFFPHRLAAHKKACLGPQAGKRSKVKGQAHNNAYVINKK